MPELIVKVPRPLQRVEIIRADRVRMEIKAGQGSIKGQGLNNSVDEPDQDMITMQKPGFNDEFDLIATTWPDEASYTTGPSPGLIPLDQVQKEVQEAYERGFEDGRELTRSTLEIELEKQQHWVRNFDTIFSELRINFSKEIEVLGESVISLAVMIAERILEHEIKSNPGTIIDQTRKALRTLDDDTVFRIHLHPYNIHILGEVKSTLCPDPSRIEKAVLVPDENIDQGGCILETSAGIIDARMKTQLGKIKYSLESMSTDNMGDDLARDIPVYNDTVQHDQ